MLSHYRVLDLSDDRGLLCGHILAQLGADVIQVESPSAAAEPRSTTRLAYTRGTRSVVLTRQAPAAEGRRRTRRRVPTCPPITRCTARPAAT